jgi:hypothetical protein
MDILYQDELVLISEDSILLKNYYFPSLRAKKIAFDDIETVKVRQSTFRTGKWRIHGTGDFRTWFPLDRSRYIRDRIFFLELKHKWIRIGFTAENSEAVEDIFRKKRLLE